MNSDSENDSLNVEIENLSMQNDEQATGKQAADDLMFIKPNSKSKKSAGDGNGKKSKKKQAGSNNGANAVATLAVQQQPVAGGGQKNNGGKTVAPPLPEVISRQPKKATKKEAEDLIDIDCFLDDDMFEQKKNEFQQYEQKVKNIDVNTEQYDPHQQSTTNEAYHRNLPHEKYDYKENILLINEQELMMVSNAQEFCEKIGYATNENGKNRLVKVCSVFGNTGRPIDSVERGDCSVN